MSGERRKRSHESWLGAPRLHVAATHCPYCYAVKPKLIRSELAGDDSQTRYYRCGNSRCREKFVYVVEPPGKPLSDYDQFPIFGNQREAIP